MRKCLNSKGTCQEVVLFFLIRNTHRDRATWGGDVNLDNHDPDSGLSAGFFDPLFFLLLFYLFKATRKIKIHNQKCDLDGRLQLLWDFNGAMKIQNKKKIKTGRHQAKLYTSENFSK